jgi:hypothetical protein
MVTGVTERIVGMTESNFEVPLRLSSVCVCVRARMLACLPARTLNRMALCMMCDFSHRTQLKVSQIQAQNTQVDFA